MHQARRLVECSCCILSHATLHRPTPSRRPFALSWHNKWRELDAVEAGPIRPNHLKDVIGHDPRAARASSALGAGWNPFVVLEIHTFEEEEEGP